MINGIQFLCYPNSSQKNILSQWMGSSRFIWNAKCQEDKYKRTFAKKYLPMGTYAEINQQYSQYKNDEFSPWLKNCPSQILRNSTTSWYQTYQNFFKKRCSRPKVKSRDNGGSILLTKELFYFKKEENGLLSLFIGTKRNNIGFLRVKWHDKKWLKYEYPSSIRIKKTVFGRYTISFCYEDAKNIKDEKQWFDDLKSRSLEELNEIVLGIDRGINVVCATDSQDIQLNPKEKETQSLLLQEKKKKKYQKKIARQQKKSNRRKTTKRKLAKKKNKQKNVRNNICHHISKDLVESEGKEVFVFEDLKIKNMTKSAKGTIEKKGKNVSQKKGLNRQILNTNWSKIDTFVSYKAKRKGKIVFKVDPKYTSQECASCGHTHPDNRKGIQFKCISCNNLDHADRNAGKVIKKRAIQLLLHSGTELSSYGVLLKKPSGSDIGRGAKIRPVKTMSLQAVAKKRQKRRIA